MTASETPRDVQGIHLKWIAPGTVALRCKTHPELDRPHIFNAETNTVPLRWAFSELYAHLPEHGGIAQQVDPLTEPLRLRWTVAAGAAMQCALHPKISEPYLFDSGQGEGEIPLTWLVRVASAHLREHAVIPADECEHAEAGEVSMPLAAAAVPAGFEEFTRDVIGKARLAKDFNDSDPLKQWPLDIRLAVAIVLGNYLYLEQEADDYGHPYTSETAALRFIRGMRRPPENLALWIHEVRRHVIPEVSAEEREGLWTPSLTALHRGRPS